MPIDIIVTSLTLGQGKPWLQGDAHKYPLAMSATSCLVVGRGRAKAQTYHITEGGKIMATKREKQKLVKKLAQAEVFTYLCGTLIKVTFNSGFTAGLKAAADVLGLGTTVYQIESDAQAWATDNCPGLGSDCVPGCHACLKWATEYAAQLDL